MYSRLKGTQLHLLFLCALLQNSEQTSDFSRKGDEVKINGCCEEENGAQGVYVMFVCKSFVWIF